MAKKKTDIKSLVTDGDQSIKKSKFNLGAYNKKISNRIRKVKPQEWIDMSEAFRKTTRLPGLPTGQVIMCYGKSDVGKSTMGLEGAAYAQKQGILPVLIITENKFSFERASKIGLNLDECIIYNDLPTIEDTCSAIDEVLKSQEKGDLPYDLFIMVDSIGSVPSKKELEAADNNFKAHRGEIKKEKSGGMMVSAKVLREYLSRPIIPKINASRFEDSPYTNTLFIVNQAYLSPAQLPSKPMTTIEPYGGDAIYLPAVLVFRQGGIMTRSSHVSATKDGITVGFALKSALVVKKNHITNVLAKGNIHCTDGGFIGDSKEELEVYKKSSNPDWDLNYDSHWSSVVSDEESNGDNIVGG